MTSWATVGAVRPQPCREAVRRAGASVLVLLGTVVSVIVARVARATDDDGCDPGRVLDERQVRLPLPPARRRGATAGLYVLLGLGYLLVSLWLQRRVLADPGGLLIGHVTADADMFAWWLHWFPFAVTHGENPLVTDWMHWPYGLNALWNTAVPLLALALAPVTLVAGSVTAFTMWWSRSRASS